MNWKGDAIRVFTWAVLPCLGALAAWIALRWKAPDAWTRRRWVWTAAGLFLLTRVGTHVLVFHVFQYAGSWDLIQVWDPIARAVLEGRDPTPWIDNLYGPLFPHVLAAGLGVSGGTYPPGIDLPFVLADAGALVLLFRIARRSFDEPVARRLTLAVLLSPILWHGVILRTQDEPLFLLFLLGTLDFLQRGKEAGGVVTAALGTAFTKAIFPFWVLPVLLAAGGDRRRMAARVAGAGGLTVALLGVFLLLGWNLAGRFHPTLDVRGSSTWFLFLGARQPPAGVFRAGLVATMLLLAVAGFLSGLLRRPAGTGDAAARGVVAVQGTFFVVSPFTLPPHLVHGLPFLAWQAVREGVTGERPSGTALALGAGFCLWQIPSLWLGSEFWSDYPLLIAAFAAWWGWTAWRAARGGGGPDAGVSAARGS